MSSTRRARDNSEQRCSPVRKSSEGLPVVIPTPRLADLAVADKEKIALIVKQFTEACRHRDELNDIVKEQESQVHHLIRERWTVTQENSRLAKEIENLRERLRQAEQESSEQAGESRSKIKKLCAANRQLAAICSEQKERISRQQKKADEMEMKYSTMVTAMRCLEVKLDHSRHSIKKLKHHLDNARMTRCFPAQAADCETQTEREVASSTRCCSFDLASSQTAQPTIRIISPTARIIGLPPTSCLPRDISSGVITAGATSSGPITRDTYFDQVSRKASCPHEAQGVQLPRETLSAPETYPSYMTLSQSAARKPSGASSGPISQSVTTSGEVPPLPAAEPAAHRACYIAIPPPPPAAPTPPVSQRNAHQVGCVSGGQPCPSQPAASRWTLTQPGRCAVPTTTSAPGGGGVLAWAAGPPAQPGPAPATAECPCWHQASADGQLALSPQAVEDWMLNKLFFNGRTPCAVSHPHIQ